ncbi:hypothetical protein SKAU_G00113250 [Synaphobranchus kaupii]|uniref:Uncharacterized protein n=1 Tax=Synaphobranchus kaupii TaxID=118154 RepID=A0A9Q1J7J2_SYNKA|nr:hypothetical protein SKAU_G00113250 [Synaphobranchus kaupii]
MASLLPQCCRCDLLKNKIKQLEERITNLYAIRDDEILIDSFVAACQTVDATGFNSPPPSPSHTEQLTADPGPKLGAQPKVRFCSTPASSEPWIIVRGEKKRDGNPSRNPSPGPIQLGNRFDVLGNSEQQLSAASLVPTTLIGPSLTEADPSPAATARPSAGRSSTRRRLLKEAVSRRSADAARADGGTHPGAVSSVRGSSPYSLANDSRRISPPLPGIASAMRNSPLSLALAPPTAPPRHYRLLERHILAKLIITCYKQIL